MVILLIKIEKELNFQINILLVNIQMQEPILMIMDSVI